MQTGGSGGENEDLRGQKCELLEEEEDTCVRMKILKARSARYLMHVCHMRRRIHVCHIRRRIQDLRGEKCEALDASL
jgi:hypothetical protein